MAKAQRNPEWEYGGPPSHPHGDGWQWRPAEISDVWRLWADQHGIKTPPSFPQDREDD